MLGCTLCGVFVSLGLNHFPVGGIILACAYSHSLSSSPRPRVVWRELARERVSSRTGGQLTDATGIGAAQAGDAAAFASLYDAHVGRVFALCLGMVGDRVMAAELTQDTFVRAWERLDTFRGESAFSSWLHRVAVNVILESQRAARRRSLRVEIEADFAASSDLSSQRGAPHNRRVVDAPTATVDAGLSVDLETAISTLPAGARAVFVLHDIAGYAHAEIAAQLQIAEGTSKAHLFRARRLLRAKLDR